jgi:DNA-binding XRE family transcriptional regulator
MQKAVKNNLRILRRRNGMSAVQLAVAASVTPATVSLIECWDYKPIPTSCERIASALGVAVSDIWPSADTPENGACSREEGGA